LTLWDDISHAIAEMFCAEAALRRRDDEDALTAGRALHDARLSLERSYKLYSVAQNLAPAAYACPMCDERFDEPAELDAHKSEHPLTLLTASRILPPGWRIPPTLILRFHNPYGTESLGVYALRDQCQGAHFHRLPLRGDPPPPPPPQTEADPIDAAAE